MSYYLLVAEKIPLKTLAAGHGGGWVVCALSLFGSNIALDMASTTVYSAVRLTWTYEKTDIPTLAIPEASSCSSGTLLLLPHWPNMHRVGARTDQGCTQIHTYLLSVAPRILAGTVISSTGPTMDQYGQQAIRSVERLQDLDKTQ